MHGFEPVAINLWLVWFLKNYCTYANWDLEHECLKVNDKNTSICQMDIDGETESLMLNIWSSTNAYDIIYLLHRSSYEKQNRTCFYFILWIFYAFI